MWVWYCLPNQTNNTQNISNNNQSQFLASNPINSSALPLETTKILPFLNNFEPKGLECDSARNDSLLTSSNVKQATKRSSTQGFLKMHKKSVSPKQIIGNQMGKKSKKTHNIKKQLESRDLKAESWNNPGRNSTSNIFRVFIKLCSKSKHEHIIKRQFDKISQLNSFFISFGYFKIRLSEVAPSTSNYINLKEFRKTCEGQSQFCKAFRCLFHWFVKDFAKTHILTLKGKSRMAKQSISCFISNLHEIENEIWNKEQQKNQSIHQSNSSQVSST